MGDVVRGAASKSSRFRVSFNFLPVSGQGWGPTEQARAHGFHCSPTSPASCLNPECVCVLPGPPLVPAPCLASVGVASHLFLVEWRVRHQGCSDVGGCHWVCFPAQHFTLRVLVSIVGCQGLHGHLGSRQSAFVSERTTNPFAANWASWSDSLVLIKRRHPDITATIMRVFRVQNPGGSSCGSSADLGGCRVRCPEWEVCGGLCPNATFDDDGSSWRCNQSLPTRSIQRMPPPPPKR